jgi:hypothetical protein
MQSTKTTAPIGAQRDTTEARQGLRASGVRQLIRGSIGALLQPIILFAAAGRLDLPRGWLYVAINLRAISAKLESKNEIPGNRSLAFGGRLGRACQ